MGVLSWGELIVLVGRHPKLKGYNIYVTMFLRVLKTFLLFFTWYCLFIVAFGLGFFIMLHKEVDPNSKEDEYVFFFSSSVHHVLQEGGEEEEEGSEEEIPAVTDVEEDFNADQYDEEAELVPTDIDEAKNEAVPADV